MNNYNILDEAVKELDDITSLEQEYAVDFTRIIQKPPTVVAIIDKEGNECEICTSGNISLIVGKAKSRKSFFISSLLVSTIKGDCSLENMRGSVDCKPMAIMFDTEMSLYHSQRMGLTVYRQLNQDMRKNYLHYKLRELPPKERLNFIDGILKKYHGDTSLIVIDGIKDLLSQGINDEPESIELVSKLMKWSTEYDLHIALVLHQNKNDKNPRGHIGTELMNKSETVLQVEKDAKDLKKSVITPLYTRGLDFEDFAFTLDDENFVPQCVDYVPAQSQSEIKMQKMFDDIFSIQRHYTYSSLINAVAEHGNKTIAAAKKNVSTARSKGIIIQKNKHYTLAQSDEIENNVVYPIPTNEDPPF